MHRTGPVVYTLIWASLMFLTWLTVWVAGIPLGAWNVVVALGIATVKASLVGLFFMHLIEEGKLTWGYLTLTGFTLLLMLGVIMFDQQMIGITG